MTLNQALRTDAWADGAYLEAGCKTPPVDLHAIARRRGVKGIKLRLMVHDGAVVPVPGGFEVYLVDLVRRDMEIGAPEPLGALGVRQRFTLAHEIVHTRFYRTQGKIPVPTGEVEEYRDPDQLGLETICDRAAARLLVPTQLLRNEIRALLNGDCERIDCQFVRMMADKFRVSIDVMIGRLRAVEPDNVFARCILLVRKSDGDHKISASYAGVTLLSILPPPREQHYKSIRNWLPDLPQAITESPASGEYRILVRGRQLLIRKYPVGKRGDFLLQIDDLANRSPDSNCV